MTATDAMNAIDELKQRLSEDGLAEPPIPKDFAARLQSVGEFAFGADEPPADLYQLEVFVEEAEAGRAKDGVFVGFDGVGVNSHAIHFYLNRGPLHLFQQIGWGGAFQDSEAQRDRIRGSFGLAASLIQAVDKAVAAGTFPKGRRLFVVESDFIGSKWGWSDAGKPVVWNDDGMATASAMSEVFQLGSKRS